MAVKATHLCYVPRGQMSSPVEAERSPPMTTVEVNGRELAALIDTGSDQTLVHPKYISPVLFRFTEKKAVRCVHGDEKLLPTAEGVCEGERTNLSLGGGHSRQPTIPCSFGS